MFDHVGPPTVLALTAPARMMDTARTPVSADGALDLGGGDITSDGFQSIA
jgi:hypothetical protein